MKCFFSNKRCIVSSFLIISLSFLVILAGCELEDRFQVFLDPSATKETPQNTPNLSTTIEPSSQAVETEAATVLTLWLPPQFDPRNGTTAGNLLQTRLDEFISKNPDISIVIRIKGAAGKGGLLESLSLANSVAPESLPTLVMLSRSDLETAAVNGLIAPIPSNGIVAKDPDWFRFVEPMAKVDEIDYGIPFAADPLVLTYYSNTGLTPQKTWQEVTTQATVLSFPAAEAKALVPLVMYQSAGGTFFDENGFLFLQPDPLLRVTQALQNGMFFGSFPYWLSEYDSFEDSWQGYVDERSKMTITWASQALAPSEVDTSFTSIPSFTSTPFTYADGWLLCISSGSTSTMEIGLQLAEFLTESEFQKEWTEASGYLPVRQSDLAAWKNQSAATALAIIAQSAETIPSNVVLSRTGIIIKDAALEILNQRSNAAQAVEQAMNKITSQD